MTDERETRTRVADPRRPTPRSGKSGIAAAGLAALAVVALTGTLPGQDNLTLTFVDTVAPPDGTVSIPAVLSFDGPGLCPGVTFSACVGSTEIVPTNVIDAEPLGHESDFFHVGFESSGWTMGCIFGALEFLHAGEWTLCFLEGQVSGTIAPRSTVPIESCVIGSPPVPTVAVFQGISEPAAVVEGVVTIDGEFRRGDCNFDGLIDLGDPIRLLNTFSVIFGQSPFLCPDACDANDDGTIDIADPITLLAYLFQEGPLPDPLLECGLDPTGDLLAPCSAPSGC